MERMLKYNCVALCCWILGLALIAGQTEGFQVATTEGARRSAVARSAVVLSNWKLEVNGQPASSLSRLSSRDTLLLNFVYTRCPTICRVQGSLFSELQKAMKKTQRDIKLLTVTIDPAKDTHDRLAAYRKMHRGDPGTWWVARAVDDDELERMKNELGVRVIADEWGGFAHSDALHVIRDGKLLSILDWDTPNLLDLVQ